MARVDPRLAETIKSRRVALGMSVQDLIAATGLTRQGLGRLLRGEVHNYQDRTVLPVCQALRWTPDSITRIIAGQPPIELVGPPEPVTRQHDASPELQEWRAGVVLEVRGLAGDVKRLGENHVALRAEVTDHRLSVQRDLAELRTLVAALQSQRESS